MERLILFAVYLYLLVLPLALPLLLHLLQGTQLRVFVVGRGVTYRLRFHLALQECFRPYLSELLTGVVTQTVLGGHQSINGLFLGQLLDDQVLFERRGCLVEPINSVEDEVIAVLKSFSQHAESPCPL